LIPDPIRASSIDPISGSPPAPEIDQLPAEAVETAIALLANAIAKATTASPMGVAGDE
jgi:hypothetical protein